MTGNHHGKKKRYSIPDQIRTYCKTCNKLENCIFYINAPRCYSCVNYLKDLATQKVMSERLRN